MSTPYLAEIRLFSFNFAPRGWAMCNGQLLPINQNQALFSLLGTTYGGNGQTTFALPDLRSRTAMHFNGTYPLGARAGEENHTLTTNEMPSHGHAASAASASPDAASPVGNFWAAGNPVYASTSNATMAGAALGNGGQNQPHSNMAPYLVLNFSIALVGLFPSRS
jgi:microcystin-dependent protein